VITGRDLRDFYEAYHVGAMRNVGVTGDVEVASGGSASIRLAWEAAGVSELSHNAQQVAIFRGAKNTSGEIVWASQPLAVEPLTCAEGRFATAGNDVDGDGDSDSDDDLTGDSRVDEHDHCFMTGYPDGVGGVLHNIPFTDASGVADAYQVVGLSRADISLRKLDRELRYQGRDYALGDFSAIVGIERFNGYDRCGGQGQAGCPEVLSAWISPQYCFAGESRPTILWRAIRDGTGPAVAIGPAGQKCSHVPGERSYTVTARWAAGIDPRRTISETQSIKLPVWVYAKPKAVSFSTPPKATPASCVPGEQVRLAWTLAAGSGGPVIVHAGGSASPTSPLLFICPPGAPPATVQVLALRPDGGGSEFTIAKTQALEIVGFDSPRTCLRGADSSTSFGVKGGTKPYKYTDALGVANESSSTSGLAYGYRCPWQAGGTLSVTVTDVTGRRAYASVPLKVMDWSPAPADSELRLDPTGSSVQMQWPWRHGYGRYELRISQGGNGSVYATEQDVTALSPTSHEFTVATAGRIRVQVRAVSSRGMKTEWSGNPTFGGTGDYRGQVYADCTGRPAYIYTTSEWSALSKTMCAPAKGFQVGAPKYATLSELTATTAKLTWGPVAGATGYEARLGTGGQVGGVSEPSAPAHLLTGLTPATAYTVYLRTERNGRYSAWLPIELTTGLAAPTGLKVKSARGSSATLSWTAVAGASGYELRAGEDGVVVEVTNTEGTVTLDLAGQAYVRAVSATSGQKSSWAPALAAPGGLNASSVQNTQMSVAWEAPAGAASYDLRYRTGGGTWTERTGLTAAREQITGLTASTRYEFQVRSRRGAAGSAWSASLFETTQAGLAAPTGLTATREATALTLHWRPAPGATLHQAALEWSRYTIASGGSQRFEGLDPETEYTLAVRALHGGSWSAFAEIKARTTAATAPPQPEGLSAIMSATGAVLSWNPAAGATSYEVAACVDGSCQTETVTATGHTFSGLRPSTAYSFSVVAKNSSGDSSAATVTEDTPALPVPSGLRSTLVAAGLVSLEWTAVTGADGYDLRYRTGAGAWTERLKLTTDFELVTGLEPATRYEFQVRARSGAARSDWSASFDATTPRTTVEPPPEPGGLSVSLTATGASLSWNLTRRATSYEAAACAGGVCVSETTTGTSARFTGLTPETSYTFSVVAKNSGGDSQAATVTKDTPAAPASLPAPSGLSLSDVGSSAASLSWARVDGAAGYEVQACAAGSCQTKTVNLLSHPFTGLTPATLYTFSVRAQAGQTYSDWAELSRRTAGSLRVKARKLADGRVELVLALHGGAEIEPVKRYADPGSLTDGGWRNSEALTREIDGTTYQLGQVSVRLDNRVCPAVVEVGLLPAGGGERIIPARYKFELDVGVNIWRYTSWFDLELESAAAAAAGAAEALLLDPGPAAGPGVEGGLMAGDGPAVLGASPAPGCAAAPTGLAVSAVTQSGATLSWTAVAGATEYDVRVGGGAQTELTNATTSYAFSGLAAGGAHTLEVRARSAGGASGWSSRAVTLPPPDPSNVRVSAATETSLTLAWDGSAGATSYEVKRTDGATVAAKAAGARLHSFSGLEANTQYTLSVRALNAGGESDWVAVVATTGRVAPPDWPPQARLSASLTARGASMSWPAAARATGYTVKACAGATCQSATVSGVSHSFSGLTPSTTYAFSVVAGNGGGESSALTASGTTPAAPATLPAPTGLSLSEVGSSAARLSWARVTGATSYEVKACAGGSCQTKTVSLLNHRFSGLAPAALYTFSVRAQAGAGFSDATELSRRTAAALRIRARRLADGRVELGLRLWDGTDIEPRSRFAALASLTNGRWRSSETLTRLIDGTTYQLGQVSVRLDNRVCPARIEVSLRPASGGERIIPTNYGFALTTPVDAWRTSSWFDLELGAASGSGGGASEAEGSLLDAGPAAASAGVEGGLMAGDEPVVSGASPAPGCAASPSGLRVGSVTGNGARLSWTAAADASQYDVRVDGGRETELSGATTSYSFSGLAAGGTYSLQVRARSIGGASAWSSRSATLPPAEPTNVQAGSPTETGLTLTWTGSSGATSYEVKRTSSTAVATKTATDRAHTFSGLSGGTRYTLSVRAVNAGGASGWVPAVATTRQVSAPDWPPQARLNASLTARGASLSWPAAARATGYTVKACAGATCQSAAVSGTSHRFSGLTPSTAYAFSVVAGNGGGASTALTASGTTPAETVLKPPTPTGLRVTTTARGASLGWAAAARATSYDVSACAGGTCKRARAVTTSHAFAGLTPSTSYTFSVAARNSGGVSQAATLQRSTQAETFSVTGRMEARRVTNGRVELAFTPSGGSRITPRSRYLNPDLITPGKWYSSSAVTGTVDNVSRTLGRITARLVVTTTARYFEICFIPQGGTRTCPTGRVFYYRDPSTVVNTWYWTGSRSYTATIGGQVSGVAAEDLMEALPAGVEDPPGASGGAMADLVPPAPADPAPDPPG
jgi:hypothetical protein